MIPTSSTRNKGFLKMIGVIQDCCREDYKSSGCLTLTKRNFLEHIVDANPVRGNI